MEKITVSIVNKSPHPLPEYATPGSAGMDLSANIDADIIMQPGERALIPTGLYIELPEGYEAQIRPRSGLAIKQGITCLNSPGTIDADYRGEIKVILVNLGHESQTISNGDRIAQMIISTYTRIDWNITEALQETSRSAGGFGHTGK